MAEHIYMKKKKNKKKKKKNMEHLKQTLLTEIGLLSVEHK